VPASASSQPPPAAGRRGRAQRLRRQARDQIGGRLEQQFGARVGQDAPIRADQEGEARRRGADAFERLDDAGHVDVRGHHRLRRAARLHRHGEGDHRLLGAVVDIGLGDDHPGLALCLLVPGALGRVVALGERRIAALQHALVGVADVGQIERTGLRGRGQLRPRLGLGHRRLQRFDDATLQLHPGRNGLRLAGGGGVELRQGLLAQVLSAVQIAGQRGQHQAEQHHDPIESQQPPLQAGHVIHRGI